MTQQNKVWAMYDGPNCPSYITRGKWYEVESQYGDRRFCIRPMGVHLSTTRWKDCLHLNGDNWQRHVGPTPPDTQEASNRQMCAYCEKSGSVSSLMGWPCCVECASLWRNVDRQKDLVARAKKLDNERLAYRKLTDAELAELKAANAPPILPNKLPPIIRTAPDADGWITHDGSAKRPKGVGKRDMVEFSWDSPWGEKISSDLAKEIAWANVTSYRVTKRAEKRRKVTIHEDESGKMTVFTEAIGIWGGKLYTAKLKEVTE